MRKVYCTDFRVLVTFPRDSGNGFIKRSFFETIQTLQGFAGQRLSLSALSVPLLPQPHIEDLKKVGRPAVLMCFIPALLEIAGVVLLAPRLLGISLLDAAVMGTVLAAVSPAVIVPQMIKLIEKRYGTEKGIPQLIMAGASVDDVFVIVLFTSLLGFAGGQGITAGSLLRVPVSVATGIAAGMACGLCATALFKRIHMRDTVKVLILLGASFAMVALEKAAGDKLAFSGLLAVMGMGVTVLKTNAPVAKRISSKFSKLWVAAEIWLFVLVGATVNINYLLSAGLRGALLVITVLLFRMLGVWICMMGTDLSWRERIFCMIAYLPKATVQAAIGSIPLSMGLSGGEAILAVAILAILLTAPLGALGIELTYKRLLKKQQS
ncbi:TPA: cation:proton antiporter [Pseudomonas aeruginosa]